MPTEDRIMISRLIRESFHAPLLTALLVAAGTTIGAFWMQDLPRDVFPDLSAPVFNVIVQNAAMGAEELETGVAIPLEVALAGLPDVRRVRSTSQLGVAQVTIEFEPDADYYALAPVRRRARRAGRQLPPGTDAPLLSSLTGRLNEIFEFTLEAEPGAADLMTLRDLAEYEVKNRLARGAGRRRRRAARRLPARVPGPARSRAHGGARRHASTRSCTPSRSANVNAAGGFVDPGADGVDRARDRPRADRRGPARARSSRCAATRPVLLGDVADVREAPAVRRGIAHRLAGEVVSCRIVKQFGADTVTVAAGHPRRDRGLPRERCRRASASHRLRPVPARRVRARRRRSRGADRRACSSRSCCSCCSATCARRWSSRSPSRSRSRCRACCCSVAGIGINTMTLGGLAIAVGLLVDSSIIMVENILHRHRRSDRDAAIASARARRGGRGRATRSRSRRSIVIAVFIPLFAMTRHRRAHVPAARGAVIAAVLAALVLALDARAGRRGAACCARARPGQHEDVALIRGVKRVYRAGARPLPAARRPRGVVTLLDHGARAMARGCASAADFMPQLDEGAFLMQTLLPAGGVARRGRSPEPSRRGRAARRSRGRGRRAPHRPRRAHRGPDAAHAVRRADRAQARPRPRGSRARGRRCARRSRRCPACRASVHDAARACGSTRVSAARRPTSRSASSGPISTSSPRSPSKPSAIMRGVDGLADLRAEQLTGLPQLRDRGRPRRGRARRARPGRRDRSDPHRARRRRGVSEIWVGQRRFDLVVPPRDDRRDAATPFATLLIDGHDGTPHPARHSSRRSSQTFGPGTIKREAGTRRIAVEASRQRTRSRLHGRARSAARWPSS